MRAGSDNCGEGAVDIEDVAVDETRGIAGEEDRAKNAVSFRYRNGEQKNGIPIADAIAEIKKVVAERTQV